MMILTDDSMAVLRAALEQQESAKKVPAAGTLLAERWDPVVSNISGPMQMRLVADLWSARPGKTGLAFFAISGATLGNFDILSDARSNHRMVIRQRTEREGHDELNVWDGFPTAADNVWRFRRVKSHCTSGRPSRSGEFTLSRYRIDAEIGNDMGVHAVTKVSALIGPDPVRTFAFDIARSMQVSAVRIDGAPAELMRDESLRGRVRGGTEEVEFLAVAPAALAPGSTHEFEFEHRGNVIATRGDGVYFVSARGSWYPHMPGQFATYDLTFRYPKRLTLVAAGDPVEDRIDGDSRITHRRMTVAVGAAGFNLGIYEKVTGTAAGVTFEVYGNRNLEESLRPPVTLSGPSPSPQLPSRTRGARMPQPPVSIPFAPDPVARLAKRRCRRCCGVARVFQRNVWASCDENLDGGSYPRGDSARVSRDWCISLPSPISIRFHGLPFCAMLASKYSYSDLMVPHEVGHQWWGTA